MFYSVEMLPSPWRELSLVNPILYLVNAFRYGMLGTSDVSLGMAFLVMILGTLALGAMALALLHRGVGLRH